MLEPLIEKISSEVSSYYALATQHRPANDIAVRTKIRRAVQAKLQPYIDKKQIASCKIVCDESNNNTRDATQPVKLDVIVKITNASPEHIISFPSGQATQQSGAAGPKGNKTLDKLSGKADTLWDKLFKRK